MSESYILRSEIYLFPALSDSVSAVLGARQRKRGIFFKPGGKRMKPGSHTHTHHSPHRNRRHNRLGKPWSNQY